MTPKTARGYLLFSLGSQLYNNFYLPGFAEPTRWDAPALPVLEQSLFVERLSAANAGNGFWETGWQVRVIGENEVVVHRGGLELRVRPEAYSVPKGLSLAPNVALSVQFPKEFLGMSPGFYMALSDTPFSQQRSQTLIRLYWNLTSEGAIPFVEATTKMLNEARLPFKLKILNDAARFTRCDAAVVYVLRNDYQVVAEIFTGIYPKIAASLKQLTPVFTKPLAPGLGLAEDPGEEESFGQHRCLLLADGMIRAYEQNAKSSDARLQIVLGRFREDGISLAEPYLNPQSHDVYHFQLPSRARVRIPGYYISAASPSKKALLETAHGLGHRLVREAVWYKDRCNWLGLEPLELTRMAGRSGMTFKALGPELYSGTSGIALFLAELYAGTGDIAVRRTAIGAIRQALSIVDAIPPASRVGLYGGWMGIALVAFRIGNILGEEGYLAKAKELLQRCADEYRGECEFDLMYGSAGAIAALTYFARALDTGNFLDFAVKLADQLLQTADRSSLGYSWKSISHPSPRNLTGFSHGTAGVGYVLLALHHLISEPKYREAADLAFQYERSWFDADAGNWPDFRVGPGQRLSKKVAPSFLTAWCHGAAGIALSRLYAYSILKDEKYRAEAMTALQTTRKMIETSLDSGTGNYSLCHGLTGNAEVVLYGSQVLRDGGVDDLGLVRRVADTGIEAYAERKQPWPCGAGGGELPSLMIGLSGIGYFYLRLRNPSIPSILIL
jgi:hypothetical protein